MREGTIASVVILALTFGLGAVLSSPDKPPVTVRSWAQVVPADFLATAASELNGTSLTATSGPPYHTNGTPQSLWFAPATIAGVRQPIDPAQTFVLAPLTNAAPTDPALAAALATWHAGSAIQRAKWATNSRNVVTKVTFVRGTPVVPRANDGPVPVMLAPNWPWPAVARSTPTCSPSRRSTAPTSPSRCCSCRTAPTTPARRPPSTSPGPVGP